MAKFIIVSTGIKLCDLGWEIKNLFMHVPNQKQHFFHFFINNRYVIKFLKLLKLNQKRSLLKLLSSLFKEIG